MKKLEQTADHEKNTRRQCRSGEEPCLRCGRPLDVTNDQCYWVHLLTTGELVAVDEAYAKANSQGLFPVGPDCGEKHLSQYIGW